MRSSRAFALKAFPRTASVALVGALLFGTRGDAQVTPAPAPPAPTSVQERVMMELLKAGRDPLAGAFFTPEAVMRHQQAIGLTAEQRTAIVAAISAAQPRFIEAQWQLEPETAALSELLRGPQVDEQAVLQQIDRVLDIERQIKRIQVEMLVRIKNELTADQQQQLTRLGGARGLGFGYVGPKWDPWQGIVTGSPSLGGDFLDHSLGSSALLQVGPPNYPMTGVPWGG